MVGQVKTALVLGVIFLVLNAPLISSLNFSGNFSIENKTPENDSFSALNLSISLNHSARTQEEARGSSNYSIPIEGLPPVLNSTNDSHTQEGALGSSNHSIPIEGPPLVLNSSQNVTKTQSKNRTQEEAPGSSNHSIPIEGLPLVTNHTGNATLSADLNATYIKSNETNNQTGEGLIEKKFTIYIFDIDGRERRLFHPGDIVVLKIEPFALNASGILESPGDFRKEIQFRSSVSAIELKSFIPLGDYSIKVSTGNETVYSNFTVEIPKEENVLVIPERKISRPGEPLIFDVISESGDLSAGIEDGAGRMFSADVLDSDFGKRVFFSHMNSIVPGKHTIILKDKFGRKIGEREFEIGEGRRELYRKKIILSENMTLKEALPKDIFGLRKISENEFEFDSESGATSGNNIREDVIFEDALLSSYGTKAGVLEEEKDFRGRRVRLGFEIPENLPSYFAVSGGRYSFRLYDEKGPAGYEFVESSENFETEWKETSRFDYIKKYLGELNKTEALYDVLEKEALPEDSEKVDIFRFTPRNARNFIEISSAEKGKLLIFDPAVFMWNESGFPYRTQVNITENSGNKLTEYQVRLTLDTSALISQGRMRPDCEDIRTTQVNFTSDSEEKIPYFIQNETCGLSSTDLWIQVAEIPASGNATVFVYYGGDSARTLSDERAVFNYSRPEKVKYVMSTDMAAVDLDVVSYYDDNLLDDGTSTLYLSEGGADLFNASELSENTGISANETFSAGTYLTGSGNDGGGDCLTPVSWGSTNFTYSASRGTQYLDFLPLWGDANVTIYEGAGSGPSLTYRTSVYVANGTVGEYNYDFGDENSFYITSNATILAHHTDESGNQDLFPLYPPSLSLFGVPTQNMYVAALEDGTTVSVYYSDGSSGSENLDQGETFGVTPGGTDNEGQPAAVHLVSNKPIGAHQQADEDGTESTVFLPEEEFDYIFYIPQESQYVAGAAKYSGTNCTLYPASGSPNSTIASIITSNSPPYPGKLYWGDSSDGATFNAGTKIVCTKPVYIYYEGSFTSNGVETNLLGPKSMRKKVYPEPSIFYFDSEKKAPGVQQDQRNETYFVKTSLPRGSKVVTVANITHDVGKDAIDSTWIEIKAPNSTVIVENASMTLVKDLSFRQYEYNHTLGSALSDVGNWTFTVYSNSTFGGLNYSSTKLLSTESTPPNYTVVGANDTTPNYTSTVLFYSFWQDNKELETAIFEWNGTFDDSFENRTVSGFSGQSSWANITIDMEPYNEDKQLCFRFHGADISGNFNYTAPLSCIQVDPAVDLVPPEINEVSIIPENTGLGTEVNITANITDMFDVKKAFCNITHPNSTEYSYEMTELSIDTFELIFDDTWQFGNHTFSVWAYDGDYNEANKTGYSFMTDADARFEFYLNDTYYYGDELVYLNGTDWYYEELPYRKAVKIEGNGIDKIDLYQFRLEFESSNFNFSKAREDGADLRLTRFYAGNFTEAPLPRWIEKWNKTGEEGTVWTKLEDIGPADNITVFVYFGNETYSGEGNEVGVFSGKVRQYVISDTVAANTLDVVAYAPGTVYSGAYSESFASSGSTGTFTSGELETDVALESSVPFSTGTRSSGDGTTTVPENFAGDKFVYVILRGDDQTLDIMSPYGASNVTVYGASMNYITSFVVDYNSTYEFSHDFSDPEFVRIESNETILIHSEDESGDEDFKPLYPESYDLWGLLFSSNSDNSNGFGCAYDSTSYTIYYSSGASPTEGACNAGDAVILPDGSQDGAGPALRVVADKPIGGGGVADSDGTEGVTFLPEEELDRLFYFPQDIEYVAISASQPYTNCTIVRSGSTNVTDQAGSESRPYPNHIRFGTSDGGTYASAGSYLICDAPVFAYYETASGSNSYETNIFGPKNQRTFLKAPPSYSIESAEFEMKDIRRLNTNITFKGYKTVRIQRNNTGSWQDVDVLHDDYSDNNLATFPAGGVEDLSPYFSYWNVSQNITGHYRVLMDIRDSKNNVLSNGTASLLQHFSVFYVNTSVPKPNITFIYPRYDLEQNYGNFTVNVSLGSINGDSNNCNVTLDGELLYHTNKTQYAGTISSAGGDYLEWHVQPLYTKNTTLSASVVCDEGINSTSTWFEAVQNTGFEKEMNTSALNSSNMNVTATAFNLLSNHTNTTFFEFVPEEVSLNLSTVYYGGLMNVTYRNETNADGVTHYWNFIMLENGTIGYTIEKDEKSVFIDYSISGIS